MRYVTLAILSLFSVLTVTHEAIGNDKKVVEFRIPAGTGKKPWNHNSKDGKDGLKGIMEVKVGEILRIFNDDDTEHLLHTTGGKPCEHGPIGMNMKKGDHYDCVITEVADPDKDECYDHNFGDTTRFYVRATN